MKLIGTSLVCLALIVLTVPAEADEPAQPREESLSPEQFNRAHKSLFTPQPSRAAGALTERLLKDQSLPGHVETVSAHKVDHAIHNVDISLTREPS